MKYVALICARSGSKGIPGKNIKPLGGVPLIGWSIRVAKNMSRISRTIVSTDSEEITRIAAAEGAEVPFTRPTELARDNSPEWLVWRHALDYLKHAKYEVDGLVVLPATAPLRSISDVNQCIDIFEKGDVDVVVTVTESRRSPYFNMVKVDDDGYSNLVISPSKKIYRRQDAPRVFDMTTVAYIVRPQFVYEHESAFEGKVRSVYVPPDRAIDIDSPLDFEFAEHLLKNKTII